jgi:hypothetical protein
MITGCKWMSVEADWFNPDRAVALILGDLDHGELRRNAYSNWPFRHRCDHSARIACKKSFIRVGLGELADEIQRMIH